MEPRGLCTGVGWHDDRLQLELRLDEQAAEKALWPLEVGRELAFRLPQQRRCIGYRPPAAGAHLLPCPDDVREIGGSQCPKCLERAVILPCLRCDGERCRNPERRPSCVRPQNHGLYLCAFGPGSYKVGVARWERRAHRVAEQGARAGLIVARDDGQMIRRYEKMIERSGVPDRLQATEKLRALAEPAADDELTGGLLRLAERLRARLPVPWLSDPEQLELPAIPALGSPPDLIEPHAGLELRGEIRALAGNIAVIASDRGQTVALEMTRLTGYELEPLAAGELTAGQMALGIG